MGSEGYTIIIPYYERYVQTRSLLEDIAAYCVGNDRVPVDKVIIADDGSKTDEARFFSGIFSSFLRVEYIRTEHTGPVNAINAALEKANTDIVVVISSDTRLVNRDKFKTNARISYDPLGYLVSMLTMHDDIGLIVPVILTEESYDLVLAMDYSFRIGDLTSHPKGLLMLSAEILSWKGFQARGILSARGSCVCFKKRIGDKEIRLDSELTRWYRWVDDLSAQIREAGKYCVLTHHALVSHPMFPEQVEGSFSVLEAEEIDRVNKAFYDKWNDKRSLFSPEAANRIIRHSYIPGLSVI